MNLLIELLSTQLNQTTLSPELRVRLTPEVLSKLYRVSRCHDLAHVVGSALAHADVELPDPLPSQFKKENTLAVYRCAQQKQTLQEVAHFFEIEQIPYIPLKGAILRNFYPQESMRVGCDVDILVHEEDIARSCAVLEAQGYQVAERNYHDVTLISPTKVHLELHFTLRENMKNLDPVLERVWEFAVRDGGYRYGLLKEFFVFQAFAHMAYHFLSGGCGLKSLTDIWVMERKMGYSYKDADLLLKEAGIFQFAKEMTNLSLVCFDGGASDSFMEQLLAYIISGGSYGTVQNKIAVQKSQSGGTAGYVIRRLFPSLRTMKQIYPVLERAPVLLPFCWVARWFSKLFAGQGRKAIREVQVSQRVLTAQTDEIQKIRTRLEI